MNPIPTTTACLSALISSLIASHSATLSGAGGFRAARHRDVEPPVPPPGGDQGLLVLDFLARIEDHLVCGGIHRGYGRLEPLDIVLLVPVRGPDVPAVEILLRPEVGLGKRRTTEWDPRLVADEHDSAPKSLISKSRRGVPSGETGTDDDDRLGIVLRGHRAHSFRARDRDEAAHAAAGLRPRTGDGGIPRRLP